MLKGGSDHVTEQDLEQLTALFRLLSDRTRLNILILLAGGERNVTNLCGALALPQPTVSHHLGLLRMNNIIGCRRSGKQVFYGLNGRIDVASTGALEIGVERFSVRIGPKTSDVSILSEPSSAPSSGGRAAVTR
jgi:DNA-binding transcriptional ArsR family regulator